MTKLQLGLSSALAVAGATGFVVQADTNGQLRNEIATLRQESAALTTLHAENQRLARLAAEVADMKRDDTEFARLQEEAGTLRTRLQQLARVDEAQAAARAKATSQVFDLSQLDQMPAPRFQQRPKYPFEMRRTGASGEVVVDFLVDANGDVAKAVALRSTQKEFEAAAVEAVSAWKFKPGRKGGQDVITHMQVPIVFTVDNESKVGGFTVKETNVKPTDAFHVKTSPDPAANNSAPVPPAAPKQ